MHVGADCLSLLCFAPYQSHPLFPLPDTDLIILQTLDRILARLAAALINCLLPPLLPHITLLSNSQVLLCKMANVREQTAISYSTMVNKEIWKYC